MTKVVIGIPCFNEEMFIEGTLLSAIEQVADHTDVEIYISDNNSTDSSVSKIESVLAATKSLGASVTLKKQDGISAAENFWQVFDNTDSELFMWLGGHDQISRGYIQRGVAHMAQHLKTALFCGSHKALTVDGKWLDQKIKYDFSQDNPVSRYLESIRQLDNCYIFHSLFRRRHMLDFDRTAILAPGADHIMVSHLLWSGTLHQDAECFFARRYFSEENRAAKAAGGRYPHGQNNVEFYQGYLQDLRQLVQPLPDLVGEAVISQASALLIQRFGLPFVTPQN